MDDNGDKIYKPSTDLLTYTVTKIHTKFNCCTNIKVHYDAYPSR